MARGRAVLPFSHRQLRRAGCSEADGGGARHAGSGARTGTRPGSATKPADRASSREVHLNIGVKMRLWRNFPHPPCAAHVTGDASGSVKLRKSGDSEVGPEDMDPRRGVRSRPTGFPAAPRLPNYGMVARSRKGRPSVPPLGLGRDPWPRFAARTAEPSRTFLPTPNLAARSLQETPDGPAARPRLPPAPVSPTSKLSEGFRTAARPSPADETVMIGRGAGRPPNPAGAVTSALTRGRGPVHPETGRSFRPGRREPPRAGIPRPPDSEKS